MKKKVTYILSSTDKAIAFEWIAKNLNKEKIELSFILLNKSEPYLHNWLQEEGIASYYIKHLGKKSYPKSILKVIKILKNIQPNTVHTHLFDANLIGLFSAKLLRIKNRIYTRHHSTYHHEYFPKAVKYDLWSNRMATKIIAISKNVEKVLIQTEKVNPIKVKLIHHGFDLEQFKNVSKSEIDALKLKYKINSSPIIGVVARYTKLKGIQYIIPAFKNILLKHPDAILVLANANGADKKMIQSLLHEVSKESYREIVFEQNLFALYKLFDIYVHTPTDSQIEAFGQTYVEALASGIPSIFTMSGVAKEFVKNRENALVVPFQSSTEIENSIFQLLDNKNLSQKLIENGMKSIETFNLTLYIQKLEKLYS